MNLGTHPINPKANSKIYFLIGPTAVGKTELALKLAEAMGSACIVSCDSMQVYRGADLISAKPSTSERSQVPHYLVDILDPSEEWNVADFRREAVEAIGQILRAGKRPLVVGGSGLYIRSLLDGIFEGPGRDSVFRKSLETESAVHGVAYLWERLQKLDPASARSIDSGDTRRVIRALEVYEQTQRPISDLKGGRRGLRDDFDIQLAGLTRARDVLYRRAEQRVMEMLNQGLVNEVKGLLKQGVGRTLGQCIGLKEIQAFVLGECTLDEATREMKKKTRHLVKKQCTWFRREKNVKWFDLDEENSTRRQVKNEILKDWGITRGAGVTR
jgi:tRNA dimethylallyltransferase